MTLNQQLKFALLKKIKEDIKQHQSYLISAKEESQILYLNTQIKGLSNLYDRVVNDLAESKDWITTYRTADIVLHIEIDNYEDMLVEVERHKKLIDLDIK